MSYPYWISPADLGTFIEGHSFTQTPVMLYYGETNNLPCSVATLNGSLPPGVTYVLSNFNVVLTGLITDISADTDYEFTLRINNGSYVADQTFFLKATVPPIVPQFEWVAPTSGPGYGYVYNGDITTFDISATVHPQQLIIYGTIFNQQGIYVQPLTPQLVFDLSWKPNTAYISITDYVYNNDILYQCMIGGTSGNTKGPLGTGTGIVDTNYPSWQTNTFYAINDVVTNDDGKLYLCVSQGGYSDSVGPGPTGVGYYITDNQLFWDYVAQAPVWDSIPSGGIPINIPVACYAAIFQPQTKYIFRTFNIGLIAKPAGPEWITPQQNLFSLPAGYSFTYQLEAIEPDQQPLIWNLVSGPTWIFINNVGLLYGQLPSVTTTTVYYIQVAVSDGVNITPGFFSVEATAETVQFLWQTQTDLGTSKDGFISNKYVQALTKRSNSIVSYGLSGGMIPPGIMLNQQSGLLEGFIEYHPQDKTYYFEITADDGTEALTKQFEWTIQSQNIGMHWNLSIPIMGDLKLNLLGMNTTSIIDDSQLYFPNSIAWGRKETLEIPIISGIRRANAEYLKTFLSQYLHNFRASLNYFIVSDYPDSDFQVVSLAVRDADSVEAWKPQTYYTQGKRVSSTNGVRYLATNSGTSGNIPPQNLNGIKDGSIIWKFDSTPNQLTGTYWGLPWYLTGTIWSLPWYPYHYYYAGNIITNNGQLLISRNAGFSGGGLGPEGSANDIQDNQITWAPLFNSTGGYGLFWPADVYNFRYWLTKEIGYSSRWGSDAVLVVNVDPITSVISSITVARSGTSYYSAPPIRIIGTGNGAVAKSKIGITQVYLLSSTTGFSQGQQFIVDFGSESSAVLEIAQVNQFGIATLVNIVSAGTYDRIPSDNIQLYAGSKYITVRLDSGVVSAIVISGGTGYSYGNTIADILGEEINIAAQQLTNNFDLSLPIGYVKSSEADLLRESLATKSIQPSQTNPFSDTLESNVNPFLGTVIPVTMIKATVEGIQWQGHARFDTNDCCFDYDQTRFVDFTPAVETLFDGNITYWDNYSTTFDANYLTTWPDFSQTVFDQGTTIFDYYQTLFDQRPVTRQSRYSRSQIWYFGKPFDV